MSLAVWSTRLHLKHHNTSTCSTLSVYANNMQVPLARIKPTCVQAHMLCLMGGYAFQGHDKNIFFQ